MEPARKTALRHPASAGGRSPNNPIFLFPLKRLGEESIAGRVIMI
jgi:hypothetical protein